MTRLTENEPSGVVGVLLRVWEVLRCLPYRMILILLALAFVGLTWWGYTWGDSVSISYSPSASSEWSKGRPVGETLLNEAVAAEATSHSIYLVWVDPSRQLHYVRLNRQAEVMEDTVIPIPTFYPRSPQLAVGAGDALHLTWLDGIEGQNSLYYARLNITGRPQIDPVVVSLPDDLVELARLTLDREGQVEIFWSSTPGILHATLNDMGEVVRPSTLLVPGGATPAIQVDQQGKIHMVWLEAETSFKDLIYYAAFDPERRVLSRPVQVASVFRRVGQTLDGLTVALDNETGYIFWSILDRRDGTSTTEYVMLPLDNPSARAQFPVGLTGVGFIRDASVLEGQRSTAYVAVSGQAPDVGKGSQIALAFYRQGQFGGHQVITASRDASLKPSLLTDVLGELHLVWVESAGFNRYRVLYASTTEEAKKALNVTTLADVANSVVGAAMSLTLVIFFLPLMLAWILPPAVWIFAYFFATHDETLWSLRSWAALSVAVLLQVVAMITLTPGVSGGFSHFILPVLLAVVALIGVYIYAGVMRRRSLLVATLIFALTHGLLRLIVYALSNAG